MWITKEASIKHEISLKKAKTIKIREAFRSDWEVLLIGLLIWMFR